VFQVNDVSHNGGKIGLYSNVPLSDWSEVWSRFDQVRVSSGNTGVDQPAALAEPLAGATEALAFDWNKIITTSGRYIEGKTQWKPNNPPVRANTNWNLSPNFANGTFQFRVLIRKMAKKDNFKLFYNHWQHINGKKAEMVLNSSQLQFSYAGSPITRTFSVPVQSLKSVHVSDSSFVPFNWSVPRELVGFFPPNWSGPADIKLDPGTYPIDVRFTVVVVAPGATFSGWNNY
jgi:hypothetical protein